MTSKLTELRAIRLPWDYKDFKLQQITKMITAYEAQSDRSILEESRGEPLGEGKKQLGQAGFIFFFPTASEVGVPPNT